MKVDRLRFVVRFFITCWLVLIALSLNDIALATCTYLGSPPGGPPPPPPTIPCCEKCEENCKGSPVFAKSGNYSLSVTDLSLPTRAFPLSVQRTYDSSHLVDGLFGYGWSSNITVRLSYSTSSMNPLLHDAVIIMPNGVAYPFKENQDGSFTPPLGSNQILVKNADASFDLIPTLTRSRWHFSPAGTLTSIVDDYGNSIVYTYDGNARLIQISDGTGSGRYLNITYGPNGRISSIQDSAGRVSQYAYTAQGGLQTYTDAAGRQTKYSYTIGRFSIPYLTQIKDHWDRVISTITYYNYGDAGANNSNRLKSYTENGETYTYNYLSSSRTEKTDSSGAKWTFDFNSIGQITSRTPPANNGGGTTTSVYNADGSVNTSIDEAGVQTKYTYNANSSISSITRDYGGTLTVRFDYAYDPNFLEKVISITPKNPTTNAVDPNWQGWRYDYYQAGSSAPGALFHVYRVQNDGTTLDTLSTYTYNSAGQILTVTDAAGGVTTYSYNGTTGDLISVTYPRNSASGANPIYQYGRDSAGRVSTVTDPLNHVTTYTYDSVDRITSVTLPKPTSGSALNFLTTYSYDNYDSLTGLVFANQTDPNSKVTGQGFDQYGQLIKSVDGLNNATMFSYNKGLLASISDANGNITSYAYNGLKRLTTTTFPDNTTEGYTYYADGLLATKRDRKNQTISFTYDHLKRLTVKGYPNNSSITYAYQGQKLSLVSDTYSGETHTFSYDSSYRIASNSQGSRGTVNYTYGAADRVSSYQVQGGPSSNYTYFADGSLNTIQWSSATGQFQYQYSLTGQYAVLTMPNGQHRDYTYDDQGRVTQVANSTSSGSNLAKFVHGYDFNQTTGQFTMLGQRSSVNLTVPALSVNNKQTKYYYDNNYELIEADYPKTSGNGFLPETWSYDAIGNRLTSTAAGVTKNYTYYKNGSNPLNGQRLQSDGTKTYTYDSNGNLTSDGTNSYTWDYENRLVSINGGATASYSYDYLGRRKSRTTGGITTTHLYDGQNLIREMTATNTEYVFGPGIDEPLAMNRAGAVYYYDVDGLESVSVVTNASNAAQDSYKYDAWGVIQTQTVNITNPFTYTAREAGEAGLMYYRARYYSPQIGRFISEDPPRFRKGPNLYSYVVNNPINYVDPSGMQLTMPPSPPSRDPVPKGCSASDWRVLLEDHFMISQQKRWVFLYSMKVQIAGTIRGATIGCMCVYSLGGIRQVWENRTVWERTLVCEPCPLSKRLETKIDSDTSVKDIPMDYLEPELKYVHGYFSENKCVCPDNVY